MDLKLMSKTFFRPKKYFKNINEQAKEWMNNKINKMKRGNLMKLVKDLMKKCK